MQWMDKLGRRARMLLRRERFDRDLDEEMRLHIQLRAEEQAERGMPTEDARAAARRRFGNTTLLREQSRDVWGWTWLDHLTQDVCYGSRSMLRTPGFTAVTVITLALGIGATTAILSAVNPILFEPLPYPHAGRLVMIWDIFEGSRSDVTFHTYRELVERSRSFDTVAVMKPWQPTMTGAAQPERFDGQSVSAGYFRVLGVSPALGRDFQASDDQFKGPKAAILSDALWRRRLGGEPAIIGHQITLDDNVYTVVGVMPSRFENVLAPSAAIWSPLQYDTGDITNLETQEWGHHLRMVGRLRAGVGLDQVRWELGTIARTRVQEFPRPRWASLRNGFIVDSLQDDVTRGVKPALLAVLGAVILVLLIACVNVANLLLARNAQRRGEFAMRAALGAARTRLIRQLLTESLLLAALGCAVGMLVAEIGVKALVALSPPGLPRVGAIGVDHIVFVFALGMTTLIGLVVGLIPALQASRGDLHFGVQQSSLRTVGGYQLLRRALVVAEVALALLLLVSAGLLLRSLEHLFAVAPGFDASHVLTMQVQTSGHRFDDHSTRHRFFEQALEAVRRVPGVSEAGFTSLLPLSGDQYGEYGAQFEDGAGYNVFRYVVTPGYLETMGIALRRGRLLDAHDVAGGPPAVLISESLAKGKFPGQDPIGQRVHVGPINRPWYIIVGVVGDVKQASLALSQSDAVYITPAHSWFADEAMSLVIRARGDAAQLAPTVRRAIWSVDKDQPIVRVATMEQLLAASATERRFALILFEAFALTSLVLAAAGIYGVLSGGVTERTREIGVRAALGASRCNILAMVLGQGIQLTGIGVAIGLAGAAATSQAIIAMLFGVSPLDPVTYLGVIALLAGVSVIACAVPAWRALRVDPASTLRAE